MSAGPAARPLRVTALIDLAADLLTVQTDTPLPPGTRVRLALAPNEDGEPLTLTGKVVGLERTRSATYTARVRLHSLSRETRTALAQAVASREQWRRH